MSSWILKGLKTVVRCFFAKPPGSPLCIHRCLKRATRTHRNIIRIRFYVLFHIIYSSKYVQNTVTATKNLPAKRWAPFCKYHKRSNFASDIQPLYATPEKNINKIIDTLSSSDYLQTPHPVVQFVQGTPATEPSRNRFCKAKASWIGRTSCQATITA